ncbi:MAG: tetratricopeptide repeat protein [Muribaculaceae bacterium]|nr:tetratricopeptide repeat protein [Muribaculaceae bacterium]
MKHLLRFPGLLLIVATILVAAIGVSSCSTKKNTAAARRYQAFITRYNVYYNGDSHFKETLKDMEQNYEDDFSQRLFMHPAEAYSHPKSPQPSGSFDRSIEKAQKAIQLHSIKKRPARKQGKASTPEYKEWLKRGEYNPFLHNAWLLMGRSQFYKGDFAGAAATFYYVSKNFTWLPEVAMEARLWQALSYCSLDWLYEAENLLVPIKQDQLTSSRLQQLYNFTYADYLVRSRNNAAAAPYLEKAAAKASGSQKTRLYFLLGQILNYDGESDAAYKAFAKAGSTPAATYRAKFNARIMQSEVFQGADIEPEVKSLRRMTRYDRNKEYLDQIYRAIGNLYLSRRDTTNAIENYKTAVEKSTRGGIDKALVQVTLGNLYFEQGRYDLAQPCLSEAVPLLPEDFPNYKGLKRRSDVLDELAVYSQNVVLQDSLLRLSQLSPEEQLKVVEKIIEELKKKEKEEREAAEREEFLAQQGANGTGLNQQGNAPSTFTLNTDDSWYFYNTSTRNAGKTEFQKRWGSRRLEDDWRRRNKATFNLDEFNSSDGDNDEEADDGDENSQPTDSIDATEAQKANDPHYPEYYLKQIPKTDEERQTANDVIQEGLYNMGVILKDKLDDFNASRNEFNTLLTRYPDNIYRLDTYYNLYLLNMRDKKPAEAEKWRLMIVNEFPESKQGQAMANPDYLNQLRRMEQEQNRLYEQTYQDYLDNNNKAVHRAYKHIAEEYPLSPEIPRFMFLDALAYVTENDSENFNRVLREMLEKYPSTEMTPLASSYLKGLNAGRKLNSGSSNTRSMIWDMRLTNDSTMLANGPEGELTFEHDPNSPQYLVMVFATDSIAPNMLLYEVARHNFNTFTVRDFDLEVMTFGRLGMLIIKGFANLGELEHYRQLLETSPDFVMPPGVRPVMISQPNFETLLRSGRSFDDYFKAMGDEMIEEVHEGQLPPDEYPSAAEMFAEPPVDEELAIPTEQLEQVVEEQTEETEESEQSESPEVQVVSDDSNESAESDNSDNSEESERPATPAIIPAPEKPTTPVSEPVKPTPVPEKPAPEKPSTPAPEPVKPSPAPKPVPAPEIPTGSEGDDPLLDY